MRLEIQKDYSRGFSTGIYQNIGENCNFRYIALQIRGLGKIALYWQS